LNWEHKNYSSGREEVKKKKPTVICECRTLSDGGHGGGPIWFQGGEGKVGLKKLKELISKRNVELRKMADPYLGERNGGHGKEIRAKELK